MADFLNCDVLHPSPADVERAVAAAGTNLATDVVETAQKRRRSFSRSASSGELAERFQPAPAFGLELVRARQVCGGPLWCVAAGGRGLAACGGADGVVPRGVEILPGRARLSARPGTRIRPRTRRRRGVPRGSSEDASPGAARTVPRTRVAGPGRRART